MRSPGGMARLLGVVALVGAAAVAGTLFAQEPPIVLPPVIGDPVVPEEPLVLEPVEAEDPESPVINIPRVPDDGSLGEEGGVVSPVAPVVPLPIEPEASTFLPTPGTGLPVEVPVPPVVAPGPPVPPLVESALKSQSIEELGTELQALRTSLAERQIVLEVREREVATVREALLVEMKSLEALQETLDRRWLEADSAWQAAQASVLEAEAGCQCGPSAPAPDVAAEGAAEGAVAPPTPAEEKEKRVVQVVAIIKTMPPEAAAKVVQSWDDGMASMALSRLPARIASKVVAALPPEHAARLTANMIRGNTTVGGLP